MGFSRQEYWRGLPLPSPYNGIKWQQILNAKWMPEGERKLSLAPYCPENEVQVYLVWHSWYLMNRLPLVFQPLLFTGIFHLEATLIISITVFTWLSMYTDLLSLVALLTYFPFLYIWILPAQGLNCHFLKWQPTPVFSPGESRDRAAWWAAIYGVAQSQIRLKWLSSRSSSSSNWKQLLPLLRSQGRWLYFSLDTSHILLCIWSVLCLLYLSVIFKNIRLEIISGLCLSSPKPCAYPRCSQNS